MLILVTHPVKRAYVAALQAAPRASFGKGTERERTDFAFALSSPPSPPVCTYDEHNSIRPCDCYKEDRNLLLYETAARNHFLLSLQFAFITFSHSGKTERRALHY